MKFGAAANKVNCLKLQGCNYSGDSVKGHLETVVAQEPKSNQRIVRGDTTNDWVMSAAAA